MDRGTCQQQPKRASNSALGKVGKLAASAGSTLAKGAGYMAAAAKGRLNGDRELDGGECVEVNSTAGRRAHKNKSKREQVDAACWMLASLCACGGGWGWGMGF
jgi:hypothetical protein